MVARVRVQRAIDAFLRIWPKIGSFSSQRSNAIWKASERFFRLRKPHRLPKVAPKIRYQYLTKKSDMAITARVGAGRSAPKLVNTDLNAGITQIMMTASTMAATTTTATG